MRFASTLKRSIYPPWSDQYIDYDKLKDLLRESSSAPASPVDAEDEDQWTERDESAFVDELVNVQLEKVHQFQTTTFERLRNETAEVESLLEPLGAKAMEQSSSDGKETPEEERQKVLQDALAKLNKITKELNELEKYSRINYTGFLKAAKKHDRKRGQSYRVLPLLRVRLSNLPFNNEDYSPLLYRLTAMFSFVRQSMNAKDRKVTFETAQPGADTYTAYKFWVHPENLLEVKTIILRRLPVLVYNPQTSKIVLGSEPDPTVTSIYFDNRKFSLYSEKANGHGDVSSLRLRWYGPLSDQSRIMLEKKVITKSGESEEKRFPIKAKYVTKFLSGEYKMEKSIAKLEKQVGKDSIKVAQFRDAVDDIQNFVKGEQLEPMMRANYSRMAFEIPGDNSIRISIDTNLAFIREDTIDPERPCRNPDDWHRHDIDDSNQEYPFNNIHKGEIDRFPFAVLEIKLKGGKHYEWVEDLMTSHLVKEAPRFSKFIHGTAKLFEDYVSIFPFWTGMVDTDIRTDPQKAFEEEQERKERAAQEELTVGSLFGSKASPANRDLMRAIRHSPATGSPAGILASSSLARATADMTKIDVADDPRGKGKGRSPASDSARSPEGEEEPESVDAVMDPERQRGLRHLFHTFVNAPGRVRARQHRLPHDTDDDDDDDDDGGDVPARLPPGVVRPSSWLKDAGPVRVEAKVWLANQRTFIKWQHVTVLLASFSLGLYNAAGKDNPVARMLAVTYTAFAVFAGAWGYGIYVHRSRMIAMRSPKDFDFRVGPIVVCIGLALALVLNLLFKFAHVMGSHERAGNPPGGQIMSMPHDGEL